MDKIYFAKNLPVEGEIKEGDLVRINLEHDSTYIGRVTSVTKKFDSDISNSLWIEGFGQVYECGSKEIYGYEVNRLKLFLCSRDMQVGDLLQAKDNSGTIKITEFCSVSIKGKGTYPDGRIVDVALTYSQLNNDYLKIIGEISPEVNWVKEGDEFDKDQVGILMEDNSIKPIRSFIGPQYIIGVVCPTCKKPH